MTHNTQPSSINNLQNCFICDDLVWGPEGVQFAVTCNDCHLTWHNLCYNNGDIGTCVVKSDSEGIVPLPKVEEWPSRVVKEWLAAIHMYRYVPQFGSVVGSTLSNLTDLILQRNLGINDRYFRLQVLLARDHLCGINTLEQPYSSDLPSPHMDSSESKNFTSFDHDFKLTSFSSPQICRVCQTYLWGFFLQGSKCSACDIVCHQSCLRSKEFPPCNGNLYEGFQPKSDPSCEPVFMNILDPEKEAPCTLVVSCTSEIEKRATSSKEAISSYTRSKATYEVEPLKILLEKKGSEALDSLRNYELPVIASVLKRFLYELIDPLVPSQYYFDIMAIAQSFDYDKREVEFDRESSDKLYSILQKLSPARLHSLFYLVSHVKRICVHGVDSERLASVFSMMILRPKRAELKRIVEFMPYHPNAVKLKIERLNKFQWRIVEFMPYHPNAVKLIFQAYEMHKAEFAEICEPLKSTDADLSSSFTSGSEASKAIASLNTSSDSAVVDGHLKAPWYWGSITKQEVNNLMMDATDGSFLVRNSTSGASYYVLVLKCNGSNKRIQIYADAQGSRCGFWPETEAVPFPHSSIIGLISHYQRHSLRIHHPELDTSLKFPIVKKHYPSSANPDELLEQLRTVYIRFLRNNQQLNSLQETSANLTQELHIHEGAKKACDEIGEILRNQTQLAINFRCQAPRTDLPRLDENLGVLERKTADILTKSQQLENRCRQQQQELDYISHQVTNYQPKVQTLHTEYMELFRTLEDGGLERTTIEKHLEATATDIDQLVPGHVTVSSADLSLPHHSEETWLCIEASREQAESLLSGKPPGCFLVRPGRQSPYVLTFVYLLNEVRRIGHCQIQRRDGYYGFCDPYYVYQDLKDLVLHYYETPLLEYNEKLDVRLLYPVNAHINQ